MSAELPPKSKSERLLPKEGFSVSPPDNLVEIRQTPAQALVANQIKRDLIAQTNNSVRDLLVLVTDDSVIIWGWVNTHFERVHANVAARAVVDMSRMKLPIKCDIKERPNS